MADEKKTEPEALPTLPLTFKLVSPFDWGAERVTEVTILREPTAGDLVQITNEKKQGDQFLRMISCATGWEDPKVKALGARDAMKVSGIVQAFLPAGPVTGLKD